MQKLNHQNLNLQRIIKRSIILKEGNKEKKRGTVKFPLF